MTEIAGVQRGVAQSCKVDIPNMYAAVSYSPLPLRAEAQGDAHTQCAQIRMTILWFGKVAVTHPRSADVAANAEIWMEGRNSALVRTNSF